VRARKLLPLRDPPACACILSCDSNRQRSGFNLPTSVSCSDAGFTYFPDCRLIGSARAPAYRLRAALSCRRRDARSAFAFASTSPLHPTARASRLSSQNEKETLAFPFTASI
jgi:hypothetical protein